MTLHLLTDDDLLILREMVREHKQRLTHAPRHAPQTHEEGQSPENHVALVPSPGGLAGRVGTQLGSAECTIYRLSGPGATPTLEPSTAQSRRVYNLSASGIAGGSYVHIWRDKHYGWLTVGGGSDIPDTDTGTGTGQAGFPPSCEPVILYEVDLRCEGPVVGTGLGTGADYAYFLNLYRRPVLLDVDPIEGCLVRLPLVWQFERTVGCCDPLCVAPDTGTGTEVAGDPVCCEGREAANTVAFTLSGELLAGCGVSNTAGTLTRFAADVLLWTNGGGTVSNDGQVTSVLRLYCDENSWRLSGTIYRTGIGVNLTFDVPLSESGTSLVNAVGSIPIGAPCSGVSVVITNPCPEGTIETTCCPNLLPETLSVAVSSKTGTCTCLPDSFTMTWNGVTMQWESATPIPGETCFGDPQFSLQCQPVAGTECNDFQFSSTVCNVTLATTTNCGCDPFSLVYTGITLSSCCTGTATLTITSG